MKIYIDGKLYEENEAKISVFDHGLLYGDGIFEGIRIYNGKIYKLDEHIDRLYESAKAIYLDIGMSKKQMLDAVIKTCHANNKDNGYIRLIVTRGDGALGIDPLSCEKSRVIIIVGDISLYKEEYYIKGIEIMTSSYRRIPTECFDTRIKSLNYLNNILAKIEAKRQNCLESIMLNTNGFVSECTADNIFIVKNDIVITPSLHHGVLDGITRKAVINLCHSNDLIINEATLTRFDLYQADECFLTGTGAEVVPVIKIDGITIGKGVPGEVTKKIMQLYKVEVR